MPSKLRVLCLCSSQPGHIDFGGKGFVRLAARLRSRGHDVSWAAYGAQQERLAQEGFPVKPLDAARTLILGMQRGTSGPADPAIRFEGFRQMVAFLQQRRPDLLLVDRVMTYAGPIAERLGIPCAAIGTPGGHWVLERSADRVGVRPSDTPIESYRQQSREIFAELGWDGCEIEGIWLDSKFLNTTFMAADWYPPGRAPQAQVCLFEEPHARPDGADRLAFSFGNQGHLRMLETALAMALEVRQTPGAVSAIVGQREDLAQRLETRFGHDTIDLHHWVDFQRLFPGFSTLVFLGGIGTTWHCLQAGLPMLVIPGQVGDQRFNGGRIEALGLGVCLEAPFAAEQFEQALQDLQPGQGYRERIASRRSRAAFSDDADSWCERVERMLR